MKNTYGAKEKIKTNIGKPPKDSMFDAKKPNVRSTS
jgi:hypothetical protein